MVSMKKLERAYHSLKTCKVRIRDYHESEAYDAVFAMTTADTFFAGIADTLLAGQTVPFEQRAILQKQNLTAGVLWSMENGELFDLSPYPELVNWARTIESVRVECLKYVR